VIELFCEKDLRRAYSLARLFNLPFYCGSSLYHRNGAVLLRLVLLLIIVVCPLFSFRCDNNAQLASLVDVFRKRSQAAKLKIKRR
jgi:hypothetical protein